MIWGLGPRVPVNWGVPLFLGGARNKDWNKFLELMLGLVKTGLRFRARGSYNYQYRFTLKGLKRWYRVIQRATRIMEDQRAKNMRNHVETGTNSGIVGIKLSQIIT